MAEDIIREHLSISGFEQVVQFTNPHLDIRAIIAVHSTSLGPALGGCRMNKYSSTDDALADVLRLAEGMSYKNSLCGIDFGGGKSVIIADRTLQNNRTELFSWFGRCVASLNGTYITAEDMGTTVADMHEVARHTSHVSGRPQEQGGGGDPSPYTALGVFEGIKACLAECYGSDDFKGRTVAIQGVGNVGYYLARHLFHAGATLYVSDLNPERVAHATSEFNATVVDPTEVHRMQCDVFSPCATGGAVNQISVNELQCKIVAGGANNVVFDPIAEQALFKRGILYAPDFAINSGGVILCASEFQPGGFTDAWVRSRVLGIRKVIASILAESKKRDKLPRAVALEHASNRIAAAH